MFQLELIGEVRFLMEILQENKINNKGFQNDRFYI